MLGLGVYIRKLVRRGNRLLPASVRGQWAVQLTYDRRFYEESYRYLTDPQTDAFCEAIVEIFGPASVIDLGCGPGYYLSALARRGVSVVGFEASLAAVQMANASAPVFTVDLTRPFRSNLRYDLAICFEVAEHLPERAAPILVESLCRLGRKVLFTAAPPGQPGIDHINLQPKAFWTKQFAREGFIADVGLQERMLDRLGIIGVPEWFCANFSVYAARE